MPSLPDDDGVAARSAVTTSAGRLLSSRSIRCGGMVQIAYSAVTDSSRPSARYSTVTPSGVFFIDVTSAP